MNKKLLLEKYYWIIAFSILKTSTYKQIYVEGEGEGNCLSRKHLDDACIKLLNYQIGENIIHHNQAARYSSP